MFEKQWCAKAHPHSDCRKPEEHGGGIRLAKIHDLERRGQGLSQRRAKRTKAANVIEGGCKKDRQVFLMDHLLLSHTFITTLHMASEILAICFISEDILE